MDVNEILARLDAGATADEIAAEMTEALNKAQKVRAEQAKANQEKEERNAYLNELAEDLLNAMNAYLGAAYDIEPIEIDIAELRDMLDDVGPILKKIENVKIEVEKIPMKETVKKVHPKAIELPVDDVIAKFLDLMNW